jgi:hypothetical protein
MLNETEFKNACLAIKDGWVPVVEPTPVEVCQGHLEAMDNNPEDGMISWDEFLMAPTNFCPSGAMINQEYVAGIWYYKQLANDEKLDSEAFKTICIEVQNGWKPPVPPEPTDECADHYLSMNPDKDDKVTKEEFLKNGPSVFCTDAANCDIDEDYVWSVYEEFDYADDGYLYEEEFMDACHAIINGWTPPAPPSP